MKRKILALFMMMLLSFSCATTVSAQEFDHEKKGSISVTLTEQSEKTPIVGAELSVYYIATVGINTDGKLNYMYTEAFAKTGIAMEDPELAAKLEVYLSENEEPATKVYTDAQGTAVCEDLPLGLYFVRQTNAVEGFAPCVPFLVTVPMESAEGYAYEVNASPKTEVAKLTSITIKKVWNTDASTKVAKSVTVQLLRKEKVVQTAILSDENNWQVTYTDMPESDAYSVKEVDIPKGFTATYKQNAYVFTVTNTSTLIQTGQLIWPIPVLAFLGVVLIATGSALLQKKRS
ncbi:MAG: Cna B-type domain-containing protein [Lachnospiraceae bacterium]|nr:Cna B-type domain-containing protein [Lachnospiraceae bacterium]